MTTDPMARIAEKLAPYLSGADSVVRLRATHLKVGWSKSMLAMRDAISRPSGESSATRFGTLVHAAILQNKTPAVFCGSRRYGKAWDEFEAAHAGEYIATADEFERVIACKHAVMSHPKVAAMFRDGSACEWHIEWDDADCGPCRATIDYYHPSVGLMDIKTTQSISPRDFGRQAGTLGYHIQLGWYRRALRSAGISVDRPDEWSVALPVYIVAVESSPPHDVAVYRVPESSLIYGERAAVITAKHYRQCERANIFPGACPDEQEIQIPDWCMTGEAAIPLAELSATDLA